MSVKYVKTEWKREKLRAELVGADLVAIAVDAGRKGPKDQKGRRQFAVTYNKMEVNVGPRNIQSKLYFPKKYKGPIWNEKVLFKLTDVEVKGGAKTTYVEPKSSVLSALPEAARAEWTRFFGALMRHEQKHYLDSLKVAKKLTKALQGLEVRKKIKYLDPYDQSSKDDAYKVVKDDMFKAVKSALNVNNASFQILADVLDITTAHGASDGVKLDTSVK